MIRVSVLYANESGKKFDADYYKNRHMKLAGDRLKSFGLIRYEVDRGLAGGAPNAPAPFIGPTAACSIRCSPRLRCSTATAGSLRSTMRGADLQPSVSAAIRNHRRQHTSAAA